MGKNFNFWELRNGILVPVNGYKIDSSAINGGLLPAGGTTNQVPYKLSNADYHVGWGTNVNDWVDYSSLSTIIGWSSFTTKQIRCKQEHQKMTIMFNILGASNSTAASFSLPVPLSSNVVTASVICYCVDATGEASNIFSGLAYINYAINPSLLTVLKTVPGAAFTASGTKQVQGTITYETT